MKSPVPVPSPGSGFINGRPPGSFALPGIHSVAAAARSKSKGGATAGGGYSGGSSTGDPVTESGTTGNEQNISEMNPSGATTQIRNIYSPDANVHSPLNGGMGGFPPPSGGGSSPPLMKNERPNTLGSVIGVNPTINNNNNTTATSTKGKKTRWLLCYPSGGAASSESPSPPTEEPQGAGSNVSTPSPTDGGFKIPNSQSNERPTSLPVALLNSSQRNSKFLYHIFAPSESRTRAAGLEFRRSND